LREPLPASIQAEAVASAESETLLGSPEPPVAGRRVEELEEVIDRHKALRSLVTTKAIDALPDREGVRPGGPAAQTAFHDRTVEPIESIPGAVEVLTDAELAELIAHGRAHGWLTTGDVCLAFGHDFEPTTAELDAVYRHIREYGIELVNAAARSQATVDESRSTPVGVVPLAAAMPDSESVEIPATRVGPDGTQIQEARQKLAEVISSQVEQPQQTTRVERPARVSSANSQVVRSKRCRKCWKVKPTTDFDQEPLNVDGLRALCRHCVG
jgi:hypothetical protein